MQDKGIQINPKLFAEFAAKSYEDQYMLAEGWSHFASSSNDKDSYSATGFFGVSFKNDYEHKIAIVFRGTDFCKELNAQKIHEFVKDLSADICFITGDIPLQYDEALDFTQKVIAKAAMKEVFDIYLIGHSLGGGLAQLVGIACSLMVVSFDAPGTMWIAKNLFTEKQILMHKNKIIAYAAFPNLVNTAAEHITQPIQIMELPNSVNDLCNNDIVYLSNHMSYGISHHSISKFIEHFNLNDRPVILDPLVKWPNLVEYYESFTNTQLLHRSSCKGAKLPEYIAEMGRCFYNISKSKYNNFNEVKVSSPIEFEIGREGKQITIMMTKQLLEFNQRDALFFLCKGMVDILSYDINRFVVDSIVNMVNGNRNSASDSFQKIFISTTFNHVANSHYMKQLEKKKEEFYSHENKCPLGWKVEFPAHLKESMVSIKCISPKRINCSLILRDACEAKKLVVLQKCIELKKITSDPAEDYTKICKQERSYLLEHNQVSGIYDGCGVMNCKTGQMLKASNEEDNSILKLSGEIENPHTHLEL